MSITIKLVNGSQKSVEVSNFDITVLELKALMEPVLEIPASEQRIVLRGKVLKDEQVLSAVGMEAGNAIHVVRAKKQTNSSNANLPNTSSASTQPSIGEVNNSSSNTNISGIDNHNTATTAHNENSTTTSNQNTTPPVNPYAALMSDFANNNTNTPSSSGIGSTSLPFGGMGAFGANVPNMNNYMMPNVSPEELNEISRNPMMQQMMAQMMQNPQLMQQMMQSSPYFQNMPPESRQQMLDMMSNPQFMSLLMNNMGGFGGYGNNMGTPGASGGVAAPTSLTGSSTSPTPGTNSGTLGMPNAYNFDPNMMRMAFSQPTPQGDPHVIYREQLNQLRDMGFPNEDANIAALQQANGNIHFAIERLFNP